MFLNKPRALDKHTAGATGGIEYAALEGLDDIHNEPDNRDWSKEFAALLALAHGKIAKEIFIDLPEGIPLDIHVD